MKMSFIYMASGFGSRFGSNKLLADLKGRKLYCYGLECLCQAAGALEEDGHDIEILVVSQYETILNQALRQGLRAIPNDFSAEGITASLRLGTAAAGEGTGCYLFFVADQPYMKSSTLTGFIRDFLESGHGIGCVCHDGKKGNPAVFLGRYREELMALTGDRGGSVIMRTHPEDVWTMEAAAEELRDIDREADLKK